MPNDSARRKALKNLPPTLNATYERILKRVNASNKDVQLLVSRTLRWIIHQSTEFQAELTTKALCEAVSINIGDRRMDVDAVPDEVEIHRWCSSLVRQSADGRRLELAHFTVKEFLFQLGDDDDGEFALYRIGPGHSENELAKVCLTYLNFQDFDIGGYASEEVTKSRFEEYPLRKYAVTYWYSHAENNYDDREVLSLTQQLLNPSKPRTLITWIQDLIPCHAREAIYRDTDAMETMNFAIAKATALHYAAMLSLPEICTWLINSGCDVNQTSAFGSPLNCGLMGWGVFTVFYHQSPFDYVERKPTDQQSLVVGILLEAGADPNYHLSTLEGSRSPLFVSLSLFNHTACLQLLNRGGRLDDRCLMLLEETLDGDVQDSWGSDDITTIMNGATSDNVDAEHYPRFLKISVMAKSPKSYNLLGDIGMKDEQGQLRGADLEPTLRAAAEFGQLAVITQLVHTQQVNVQASEEYSGLTALHYAAKHDHRDIVEFLLSNGAQACKADDSGWTTLHYVIRLVAFDVLTFFWKMARVVISLMMKASLCGT